MSITADDQPINPKPTEELKRHVNAVANEMHNDEFYGLSWQPKLLEATEFVLSGAVDIAQGKVHSGTHAYEIDATHGCTCPYARLHNRYCKHFVAWEMQKRVDVRTKADTWAEQNKDVIEGINERAKGMDMPPKPKANAQDEWEAKMQNGEEVDDLFGDAPEQAEPEPDDVPEPEVPEHISRVAQEMAEVALDLVEKTVYTKGHQYTDYPATYCIKRLVGHTEVMCTFRDANDDAAWARMAKVLDRLEAAGNKREQQQTPPMQQAPAVQATGAATPAEPQNAPQATYVETAAGQLPMCPVHLRPMKTSQFGGFYCTGKNQDGSYCKAKV